MSFLVVTSVVYFFGFPPWLIYPLVVIIFCFEIFICWKLFRDNYIAGKTEEDALRVFQLLAKRGFRIISDIVGEKVKSEAAARQAAKDYINHPGFFL